MPRSRLFFSHGCFCSMEIAVFVSFVFGIKDQMMWLWNDGVPD